MMKVKIGFTLKDKKLIKVIVKMKKSDKIDSILKNYESGK
jgi:hypothetical protein